MFSSWVETFFHRSAKKKPMSADHFLYQHFPLAAWVLLGYDTSLNRLGVAISGIGFCGSDWKITGSHSRVHRVKLLVFNPQLHHGLPDPAFWKCIWLDKSICWVKCKRCNSFISKHMMIAIKKLTCLKASLSNIQLSQSQRTLGMLACCLYTGEMTIHLL